MEQGRFTEDPKHHKQYLAMSIQLQNLVSEQRALATLSCTLAWSTAEPSSCSTASRVTPPWPGSPPRTWSGARGADDRQRTSATSAGGWATCPRPRPATAATGTGRTGRGSSSTRGPRPSWAGGQRGLCSESVRCTWRFRACGRRTRNKRTLRMKSCGRPINFVTNAEAQSKQTQFNAKEIQFKAAEDLVSSDQEQDPSPLIVIKMQQLEFETYSME